jgi:hypothetical protein
LLRVAGVAPDFFNIIDARVPPLHSISARAEAAAQTLRQELTDFGQ